MVSEAVSQGASGQGRWHFRSVTWFVVGRVASQAAPNNTFDRTGGSHSLAMGHVER